MRDLIEGSGRGVARHEVYTSLWKESGGYVQRLVNVYNSLFYYPNTKKSFSHQSLHHQQWFFKNVSFVSLSE